MHKFHWKICFPWGFSKMKIILPKGFWCLYAQDHLLRFRVEEIEKQDWYKSSFLGTEIRWTFGKHWPCKLHLISEESKIRTEAAERSIPTIIPSHGNSTEQRGRAGSYKEISVSQFHDLSSCSFKFLWEAKFMVLIYIWSFIPGELCTKLNGGCSSL